MSAIVTLQSRIINAKEYINRNFDSSVASNYSHFFTGRSIPWDDETSPNVASSSGFSDFETLFYRIFMKRIEKDDTILAIKRFNWTSGTVYTRADYNVDITDYRKWYHPESPFYVINSSGNVYKCISNNNDSASTVEPTGTSVNYLYTGDDYIWKFMFDLSSTIEDTFLTDTWIPVPYLTAQKTSYQLAVESNAVEGDIIYIHVDNPGENYTSAPTVQIWGDGSGATATAIMSGGTIDKIQVINAGSGYTHAEVKIFGDGTNGSATAMLSPVGGHGSDAVFELGAFYVEIATEIVSDESGYAPTTNTYRSIGIVNNTYNTSSAVITDTRINTLSTIHVENASGDYNTNEIIIGEDSLAQGIVYNDPSGVDKDLEVYTIEGTFTDGERLHGQTTGEVSEFDLSSSTYTTVDILSGELIYKENIIFITRKSTQIERFVFTIEF